MKIEDTELCKNLIIDDEFDKDGDLNISIEFEECSDIQSFWLDKFGVQQLITHLQQTLTKR